MMVCEHKLYSNYHVNVTVFDSFVVWIACG